MDARRGNLAAIGGAVRNIAALVRVPLTIVAAVSASWCFIQCVAGMPSLPVVITAAVSTVAAGMTAGVEKKGGEA